jgi:hypothetical protein
MRRRGGKRRHRIRSALPRLTPRLCHRCQALPAPRGRPGSPVAVSPAAGKAHAATAFSPTDGLAPGASPADGLAPAAKPANDEAPPPTPGTSRPAPNVRAPLSPPALPKAKALSRRRQVLPAMAPLRGPRPCHLSCRRRSPTTDARHWPPRTEGQGSTVAASPTESQGSARWRQVLPFVFSACPADGLPPAPPPASVSGSSLPKGPAVAGSPA